MKKIFGNYLETVKTLSNSNYLDPVEHRANVARMLGKSKAKIGKSLNEGQITTLTQKDLIEEFDYSGMSELFGVPEYMINAPHIGNHPDFTHLQNNETENHYAVSMFVDIKGSTLLSKNFNLQKIRLLKDTVLTLVIYICNFFGGHIQRLQGDGVFVYFVRRGQDSKDAVISALNAASTINYFMKYELVKVFENEEATPLKVRTGIDYGSAEQVLWSWYGVPSCNELTTTSLHTDMAAKLQGYASGNGIMVGDNIQKIIDLHEKLVSNTYEPIMGYKKWNFNWENYFNTFDFIKKSNNKLSIEIPEYRLKCIARHENEEYNYSQNLDSIKKDSSLIFQVEKDGNHMFFPSHHRINWRVKNTGTEAKYAKDEEHNMNEKYENKIYAEVGAKYLGQHFMHCKISRGSNTPINLKFPIFVR